MLTKFSKLNFIGVVLCAMPMGCTHSTETAATRGAQTSRGAWDTEQLVTDRLGKNTGGLVTASSSDGSLTSAVWLEGTETENSIWMTQLVNGSAAWSAPVKLASTNSTLARYRTDAERSGSAVRYSAKLLWLRVAVVGPQTLVAYSEVVDEDDVTVENSVHTIIHQPGQEPIHDTKVSLTGQNVSTLSVAQILLKAAGDHALLTIDVDAEGGVADFVYVARFHKDSGFATAEQLLQRDHDLAIYTDGLSLTARGDAMLAWVEAHEGMGVVKGYVWNAPYATWEPLHGADGTDVVAVHPDAQAGFVAVSLDAIGSARLAWYAVGNQVTPFVTRCSLHAECATPFALNVPQTMAAEISIASNATGAALVAWSDGQYLLTRHVTSADTWSDVELLPLVVNPKVALNDSDRGMVLGIKRESNAVRGVSEATRAGFEMASLASIYWNGSDFSTPEPRTSAEQVSGDVEVSSDVVHPIDFSLLAPTYGASEWQFRALWRAVGTAPGLWTNTYH